ncbi:biliverdin binding protein-I, partial [Danaus plexippus plexippus]
NLKKMH